MCGFERVVVQVGIVEAEETDPKTRARRKVGLPEATIRRAIDPPTNHDLLLKLQLKSEVKVGAHTSRPELGRRPAVLEEHVRVRNEHQRTVKARRHDGVCRSELETRCNELVGPRPAA